MEWLFLTGLITGIAAFWNQAKSFAMQAYGRIVVTIEVTDVAAFSLLTFLRTECKASRFGLRTYRGWLDFVRPEGRRMAVAAEALGKGTRVYWIGRLPIWITRGSSVSNPDHDATAIGWRPVSVSFFRGTIDPDQLVSQAVEHYNGITSVGEFGDGQRHRIEYISGTDGKPARFLRIGDPMSNGPRATSNASEAQPPDIPSLRLLKWKHADIGPAVYGGSALDRMYLCDDALRIVDEVRHWLNSRDWHRDRGLPWKRNFGLKGGPGTGKTTLIRAIGEDLDLPIFVFDLATLYNDELRAEWSRIQARTPCIALFDDVDGVFEDRTNSKSSLTFDCFINCLDGVGRSDGILTFITTNRPELLANALTRPGRIDRLIEMNGPDAHGRQKIAGRILSDWPQRIPDLIRDGDGDSGAEFERRCAELALELFWSEPEALSA